MAESGSSSSAMIGTNTAVSWLRPRGNRAAIVAGICLAWIGVVALTVYQTGGTGYSWLHLMYLPIIFASAAFGIPGGIVAAVIGGVAIGPFMPMNVVEGLPQSTANWLFRTVFFLLVGILSGLVSKILNDQIDRLKNAHSRLNKAHEELKATQMQLIQTAKLESVGRLAAGIAHEVKNPLAIIQMGLDFLSRAQSVTVNVDCVETVQEMEDAVQRADTVIKGLLGFSRSESLELVSIGVNSIVEESIILVRHELNSHGIALEKELSNGLLDLKMDRNKVKQVFINVFMNAIQAMGDKGALTVKTSLRKSSDKNKSDEVLVEILDTGPGIAKDKEDKLFEPFFTTKPIGSGTGLGLSVSRKIIELHQGKMTLTNRTDTRGAAVTITFSLPKSEQ